MKALHGYSHDGSFSEATIVGRGACDDPGRAGTRAQCFTVSYADARGLYEKREHEAPFFYFDFDSY